MRGFLLRLGLQLLIVLDARAVDHQLTLHVHPLGDDANDGSALAPMRTPNGARDKLRQLISTMDSSGSLEGGMTEVILHPGIYPPLHLHEADSGTIQHPVLWTGRPGAVLSGGVQIPPHLFTPRSPGDEVLVANLSAVPDVPADLGSIVHGSGVRGCLNDRVELFVGTHRMVLARFPNLNVQPSDGTISWDANWLRGNGNFNMHGSEAYCKGEDPQNVTGCILLNPLPKALGAHVHDVATSLGSCANVSGEWRDKYQPAGSDTMHITQVGCSLTITDPAGSWRTATGTIDGVQITAKFGGKPTSPVLIGVYHDGTTPRKITWSNHGVWTQGHYPPCPLKVCATHPNRTYCPSNSTPGQCDHAPSPASSCPPCATSPVAQRAARWVAEGTGWIHAYLLFDWADTYNKIIDVVRGVELRYDPPDQTRNNARFYVVNLLSELDAPGEYFIDHKTRQLYFYPPTPLSATSPPVLSKNATALQLNGVNHVTVRGLEILHARGSGVSATGVTGISIRNCTVAGHALDGITLLGTDSEVVDTTVHDCGCAGIRAHGGNDTLLTPGNLSVLRNEIYDVAQWKRTYTPGIHWGGVSNTYSHNTVHKLPHNCFLGGGNEVKQVQPGGATYERPDGKDGWYNYPAVATANNSFEFNVLDGCGYECDDTGGFCKLPSRKGDITNYSNGSISNCVVQITELRRFAFALHADTCGQQGTAFVNVGNAVRHNTFRNIKAERAEGVSGSGSNSQAIYLDDIMSNWEIYNNTFTNCDNGIAISGRFNLIHGNRFIHVNTPISGGVRGSENTNCSKCAPAPPIGLREEHTEHRDNAEYRNCSLKADPPFSMQCVTEGVDYLLKSAGGRKWLANYPVLQTLSVPASSAPSDNIFANNTWCGAHNKHGGEAFSSFTDKQWEAYGSTMVNNQMVSCPLPQK